MMYKYILYYFVFFQLVFEINIYAQANYSNLALTGRGDLVLTDTQPKLNPTVYSAFLKMQTAALRDGVSIKIVSGYRSFKDQQNIWNRKYTKFTSKGLSPQDAMVKIIQYSTLPGSSRHHWGTEIDIIDASADTPHNLLVEKNFTRGGCYEKLKKWMDVNSEKFGFYLTYTCNTQRKGFKYEPWHYSYKPISVNCLRSFLKIDLLHLLNSLDVNGSNYITNKFLENYLNEQIQDINPELK